MTRCEKQEKMIRTEWFGEHKAEITKIGRADGPPMWRIKWAKPGTSIMAVRYIVAGGTLIVLGDLGDAVYRWNNPTMTPEWLAGLSIDYFAGKCTASENGRGHQTWDVEAAVSHWKSWLEDLEPPDRAVVLGVFESHNGKEALDGRQQWAQWLEEQRGMVGAPRALDDWEVLPNLGDAISIRCLGHLIGLKMVYSAKEA